MKSFFITGTGTDVGKTFILEGLIKKSGKVDAIKPVISGFEEGSDTHKISAALGDKDIDKISLYRLRAPLSPDIAAKRENIIINFDKIVDFCKNRMNEAEENGCDNFFIEGAGGIMTPISEDKTFLDLMVALDIPVILVTSNYLGCISHSLTALNVLKEHKIKLEKIILNEIDKGNQTTDEIIKSIELFSKNKVYKHQ